MRTQTKVRRTKLYRGTSRVKHTRRCRTDDPKTKLGEEGTYLPNFFISSGGVQDQRPEDAKLQDNSRNSWLTQERISKIVHLSKSTGILFVGDDVDKKKTSSSTWWILETANKCVGVTVLHSALDLAKPRFFVLKDENRRVFDTFEEFSQAWKAKIMDQFTEVQPILLNERLDWIKSKENDTNFVQWNVDAEYGLQPRPVLDIMFFQLPQELASLPGFTLSPSPPIEDSTFGLIGYHHIDEETEPEMYKLTSEKVPDADKLLNEGRSLSLGIIKKFGPIATTISTMAEQSSGGPLLDADLNVFGISIGSYYDDPTEPPQTPSPAPEVVSYDVEVQENPNEKGKYDSRNRNLALTTLHPGFQELVSKL